MSKMERDDVPRITVITVGVDDLERAPRFYRDGLGLPMEGIIGMEFAYKAMAFFDLQSEVKLALQQHVSIVHDMGLPTGPPSPTKLTLGHNLASRAEVDAVMEHARQAGAVIVKAAHNTF
jgi:catechol 2,3-dioxygenase-like lactoylglutathione lyase family enzyme